MSQGGMGGGVVDTTTVAATTAGLGGSVAMLPATAGNAILFALNIAVLVACTAVVGLYVASKIVKHAAK